MNDRLIVFGDDGSEGADAAWQMLDEQTWPGWRVEVLTAHMPAAGPPPPEKMALPHRWSPERPRVPSPSNEITSIEHLYAEADPRLVLWRPDADLIVVGPTGHGVLKRLHLGSTAEYLLHHPAAPTVFARAPRRIERVVMCADGSKHALRAAETLAAMPWIDGVIVEILGVEDLHSDIERGAQRVSAALADTGAKVSTHVAVGPVGWTIIQRAEATDADLIVLGTRGLGALRRLVVGSAASTVVRAAPCSVLVASDTG